MSRYAVCVYSPGAGRWAAPGHCAARTRSEPSRAGTRAPPPSDTPARDRVGPDCPQPARWQPEPADSEPENSVRALNLYPATEKKIQV